MFLSTIFENRKHYLRKSPLSFEDIQITLKELMQILKLLLMVMILGHLI